MLDILHLKETIYNLYNKTMLSENISMNVFTSFLPKKLLPGKKKLKMIFIIDKW